VVWKEADGERMKKTKGSPQRHYWKEKRRVSRDARSTGGTSLRRGEVGGKKGAEQGMS